MKSVFACFFSRLENSCNSVDCWRGRGEVVRLWLLYIYIKICYMQMYIEYCVFYVFSSFVRSSSFFKVILLLNTIIYKK